MPSSEKNKIKLNNPEISIREYKHKEDVIYFLKNEGQKHTIEQQVNSNNERARKR